MSCSSSTFASFIVADIVSLFTSLLSQVHHRLLNDLISIRFEPLLVGAFLEHSLGLPRVHVLISLVIETEHPCTQLISGRDDILPWMQMEQP